MRVSERARCGVAPAERMNGSDREELGDIIDQSATIVHGAREQFCCKHTARRIIPACATSA